MKEKVSYSPITPSYFPFSGRLLVALLVAHYVVVHAQTKPVLQIVQQLNYYIALVFSFTFAFMLIHLIHLVTKRLDIRCNWILYPAERLLYQFLFGVVAVLVLDVLLVWFYFILLGGDFWTSGYMNFEFHTVAWMVVSLNMMYGAWYFVSNYYRIIGSRKADEKPLIASLGQKRFSVFPSEVVCFIREDYLGYVCLKDGHSYNIDYRMSDLQDTLSVHQFFQVNRSLMVNRDAIKGYKPAKNNQAELILKYELTKKANLTISRDRYKAFRKFWYPEEVGLQEVFN